MCHNYLFSASIIEVTMFIRQIAGLRLFKKRESSVGMTQFCTEKQNKSVQPWWQIPPTFRYLVQFLNEKCQKSATSGS